ncbi:MAG: hypothetical protein BGO43_08745 [Gammaproteobacteria bacterium 39-13]|nr:cytochrome b5 domain-containing protein [Gammaproteobacteria bacterium]OJV94330.1 MAG: hypothetical protein BGO43_08745 [Gammaproteobacteria bacterium 39-13]
MKKYFYLIVFLSTLLSWPCVAIEKFIPLEEIQLHNNANSCWIIVNNNVFDITQYIKMHESKCKEVNIIDLCGKDATIEWLKKEKSDHAHKYKSVLEFEKSQIGISNK